MAGPRTIALAKLVALASFVVLLSTTYYLRSEVLTLNSIRFSADETRAEYHLEKLRQDHPREIERHEIAKKNHELQMEHYAEMLDLYKTDYNAYTQRLVIGYTPPALPNPPTPPTPPEYRRKLMEINAAFRARRHHYFETTAVLNWAAWVAAVGLVGGLLFLIFFDSAGGRIFYFATLVLSFTFLIGPSFHSILSAIVGFLEPPSMY